jgi:hypothetical protein
LEDARQQQNATIEILRAISEPEFQLEAILQGVAETAARLCRADGAVILAHSRAYRGARATDRWVRGIRGYFQLSW